MTRLLIVTPVYNDWRSFSLLLARIDEMSRSWGANVDVIAIDDGSNSDADIASLPALANISQVSIVRLVGNLGHQRAIAVGLVEAVRRSACDAIVVMDSDGEDRPEEINDFIAQAAGKPGTIVVARRSKRSEGARFRSLYSLYKLTFRIVTGHTIDFGNYCLIPMKEARRLVYMPELWNHLAASIIRSRIPMQKMDTERGSRYAGKSSMRTFSLVAHGLSAMAAFSDILFVRLLAASAGVASLSLLVAAVAVALRLFTDLAVPGWATNVVGFALVVFLQVFVLSVTATFAALSSRANLQFIPAIHAPAFIREVEEVKKRA